MTHDAPSSLASALARARARLGPDMGGDAEILLTHVLRRGRAYLHTWPERVLTSGECSAFDGLVERRLSGEPVAYLTGQREFWSLVLAVSPATLIPRPDTETLVAQALSRIPLGARWRVADLGTGSGAIALAIAHDRPACQVTATDASPAALAVARENLERLGFPNVELREGIWFAPLEGGEFHVIVSNPPYIAPSDPHLGAGDLRFEPHAALVAAENGLADLRLLITEAPHHLAPGGWLLLEHGYDQGEAVRGMMAAQGFTAVETCQDLEHRDRVTVGRRT